MFGEYQNLINVIYLNLISSLEYYGPKVFWALIILVVWAIISRWFYILLIYLFRRFNIIKYIDKWEDILVNKHSETSNIDKKDEKIQENKKTRLSTRMSIDKIISKSIAYYIFIIFFRFAISYIWITEVEEFLKDLIEYLPSLFIWILIWFFGIRFANFIYDIVYHALNLTRQKTSRIIAMWAKIIILFFTFMLVLDYIKIVDGFIINTILIWFVAMLSLAWGLAFWLGGKDVAKEIIESFRK